VQDHCVESVIDLIGAPARPGMLRLGIDDDVPIPWRGADLLEQPLFNKDTAFPERE
jgi:hypothetical protein